MPKPGDTAMPRIRRQEGSTLIVLGPGAVDGVRTYLADLGAMRAYLVTGASLGSMGDADYATVAYDAYSGAQRWVRRYNGPGKADDYAYALAVSPRGSAVFVTGESTGSTGSLDYATVAYRVTGRDGHPSGGAM